MLSNIRPVIVCVVLLTFGTVATQALGGEPANKQPVVIAAAASADQASIYIEGMNAAQSQSSGKCEKKFHVNSFARFEFRGGADERPPVKSLA